MFSLFPFLQSEHVIAFLTVSFIFIVTIFLVAKRWIGFTVALLLLLSSLLLGFVIDYKQLMQHYFSSSPSSSISPSLHEDQNDPFHKQMIQAMEDLKIEVDTEKENLRRVMGQMQEVIDSVDAQKQKLQNFIEETRERFKTDFPASPSTTSPSSLQSPPLNSSKTPTVSSEVDSF